MTGLAVPPAPPAAGTSFLIDRPHFPELFGALHAQGYTVVGPTVRDGAIVYDELGSADDLPAGWTADQDGGRYRLHRRADGALFGYASSPHAWKRVLHPPSLRLFGARRDGKGLQFLPEDPPPPKLALLGVRPCDVAAIARQDQVLTQGPFVDRAYQARREGLLVIAVACGEPGGTCFCASMGTGPGTTAGFDLALTEVLAAGQHYFTGTIGSDRGRAVLEGTTHRDPGPEEAAAADAVVRHAAGRMGRTLETQGLREALVHHAEHPRWDDVAKRCLTCGNCTMACPTCFCTTVEDHTDLAGDTAERWRKWDSCFAIEFSYMYGGSVRLSASSRYRQWLTHKLGTWHEQFGVCGCVGCGRCITWCPVGIDITVEARAIREAAAPTAAVLAGE